LEIGGYLVGEVAILIHVVPHPDSCIGCKIVLTVPRISGLAL